MGNLKKPHYGSHVSDLLQRIYNDVLTIMDYDLFSTNQIARTVANKSVKFKF